MQPHNYPITEWAKDDQPQEKLLSKNPQILSITELLAILIRTGTRKSSALELAQKVYQLGHNNLQELGKLSIAQMKSIHGIGSAKAATLVAALELGSRRMASPSLERIRVTHSRELAAWLRSEFKDYNYEVFGAIYLNNAGKILKNELVSRGGITGTHVDPRLILKKALLYDAVSLIVYHNHPSGNLKPSQADKDLTIHIKEGASYLNIKLMDHLIVSEDGHFSFADNGLI